MSEETPPTYTTSIFNQANFNTSAGGLDTAYLNSHYLKYPTAQSGTETIPNLATTNDATINTLTIGTGSGTGISNTALGGNALESATTASYNTAVGHEALYATTTNGSQTAVGFHAARNSTGSNNLAIGYRALRGTAGTNSGNYNVAIGEDSLLAITTAQYNTALGYKALSATTTGNYNVAIGYNSLLVNVGGLNNTAVGGVCLSANSGASNNTAVGAGALQSTTSGGNNTALGYQAGFAGTANTTGTNNTYIGHQAQANGSGYSNSTALGSGAVITASNQVVLGTSNETVVIPNQINYSYTSNPTLSVGSIGYNYQYSFSTASLATGATRTLVSFTNTPVGIYFCFVNLTVFDVNATSRIDITITVGTNITFLNSSSGIEMGGNAIGKLGFNNIYPIKITNATNQLTIILNNVSGPACQLTGGVSNLMRIA